MADRLPRHHLLPVAWVSLDAGDNNPVRFWRYSITACQAFQADLGRSSLALLGASHTSWHPSLRHPSLEAVLTTLLNEIAQLPGRGVLVLEDYHVITSSQIHETLAELIEHLPATLHLILMTRSDPPLPLARLRARDELVELHAADLRFSQEEREIFLRQAIPFMQSSLSSEAGSRLFARTEGWAAGLRLLALALQGRMSAQEIEQYLSTFSGSQRHLLEYFVTEVLDAQPQPLHVFLLQTSVLSRLTGSLCDAVTGRNDSEQLLETVDRAGLFLLPLDGSGQWYRYHALFAEAMQHEARRRLGEDALRSCYGRASSWYEQHGMLAEAIEAALSAGGFARTAILIERLGGIEYFTERHELYTLQRWLEQLPESVLHAIPALCFIYANALVFASVPDQLPPTTLALVEALLQKAEQGWRSVGNAPGLGEVLAFRALLVVRQGEIKEAASLARQALAWLPEEERFSTSRVINKIPRPYVGADSSCPSPIYRPRNSTQGWMNK